MANLNSRTSRMPKPPSVWRILTHDRMAYLAVCFCAFASAGAALLFLNEWPSYPTLFAIAAATTFLLFLLFAWRVRLTSSIVTRDEQVIASVSNVRPSLVSLMRMPTLDATLTFQFQGQVIRVDRAVSRRPLRDGDELVLLLDPDNPKRFILRDDYV